MSSAFLLRVRSGQAYRWDGGIRKWVEIPISAFNNLTNRVNLTLLKNNNLREWIRYTYFSNPNDFAFALSKLGIIIEGDLDTEIDDLIKIHNSGAEDILSIMKNIKVDQKSINSVNLYTAQNE